MKFESGGARLVGRLFAPGRPRAAVLAHQVDDDQSDWFEFAGILASKGYTVLTFNFQGYCGGGGCSGGGLPTAELWTDIAAAVAFLEGRGAERIGLIGASLGGEASIAAAAHLGSRVSAVATLSASLGLAEIGLGDARRDAAAIRACAVRRRRVRCVGRRRRPCVLAVRWGAEAPGDPPVR
ncbi:MAG TPA: alpha/beta fold hydrolase [Actinomycetota bacterium]|nr:alpha/beta fold hydrolase [Actinomycetota bacterium]